MRSALFPILLSALVAAPALAQSSGYLKTKVNPGRAGVFIDGKYLGAAASYWPGITLPGILPRSSGFSPRGRGGNY